MLISLIDAETYLTTHLFKDAWTYSDDTQKTNALIKASEAINKLNFICDTDMTLTNIKEACVDEALVLLDGKNPEQELENLGVSNDGFSSARSGYDPKFAKPNILAGIMSNVAWNKLLPYLKDNLTLRIVRAS